ncbi:MAG: TonB-dependent receptor [Opitutaceae bacterium]|nr:TonB-dependent receptor [Opitutaceae bacterium]
MFVPLHRAVIICHAVFGAICALSGLNCLLAQPAGRGSVSGLISNQATGDLLPGALVVVEGTSISTTTERGGGYTLSLPEGTHTLIVSYSGLDAARIPVTVTAGQAAVRDVQLTSGIYKMDAFAVTGVREGNALAIQTQRHAENPKWVAATDTFGNPAANPGELIQRLPGISTEIVGGEVRTLYMRGMGTGFSSLMVDGERSASSSGTAVSRDYQIEQLGTGNLESVELIKAPQPDQDANAVAGYVNLVSRRAFDQPGRRITVTAGTIWKRRGFDDSPYKDRADDLDLFTFAYSNVFSLFGARNNLGVAVNYSQRVAVTTQDEQGPAGNVYTGLSQAYLNANTSNPLTRAWGTGEFAYPAKAQNAGVSAEYKLNPDAYVFLKFSINFNDMDQIAYRSGFGNPAATVANFTPDSTYEHSFMLPHPASVGITNSGPEFTKHSRNFSLNGGTEFKLFDRSATLLVRGNMSQADISYPGNVNVRAITTAGVGFEIDRRGQDEWYPLIRQIGGPDIYDPASYNLRTMTRQSFKAPNELYGFRADFTKRFALPVPATVKLGVKYADDTRQGISDYAAWTFVGADRIPNSTDDNFAPYADLRYKQGDGRYGPIPYTTRPTEAPAGYWRQTAADAYNSVVNAENNDRKFNEKISAAYIQGSVRLGRVRVLGGIRVEETKTEGTAWVRNTTASWGGNSVGGASVDPAVVAANAARAQRSFVRRNTDGGQYRNVFPGVHFVYEPFASLLARASYNRAISRPSVANLIPTVTENLDTNTVSMGNPELRPFISDNFEVSLEKYFEPVGQFSLGVFLKEISDYSRSTSATVGPEGVDGQGLYAGYTLTTQRNVGSARIRGIEASYQHQFSFLPGAFKGLGAVANFTYLQAVGNFGTTTTTTKLGQLAPRSGNAGLNYRHRGLDVRLLVNWTDLKYKSTNGGVDVYADERLFIDVKMQYGIRRGYDVFLDISNLTDEPTRTDIALTGPRFFRTNQGVGFVGGVRGRF